LQHFGEGHDSQAHCQLLSAVGELTHHSPGENSSSDASAQGDPDVLDELRLLGVRVSNFKCLYTPTNTLVTILEQWMPSAAAFVTNGLFMRSM
jgi:hypothetical protein